MKNKAFFHFFIYSFILFFLVLFLLSIIDLIKGRFVLKDTIIVLIGILLFCTLFSLFASIYAKRIVIVSNDIVSFNKSLENLENNKDYIIEKGQNIIIISSSKYYEWFYGKTIISIDSEKYRIEGARCFINKYFKVK